MIRLTDFSAADPYLYVDPRRIVYVETIKGAEDEPERLTTIHLDGADHTLQVRETPTEVLRLKTGWENRVQMVDMPAADLHKLIAAALVADTDDGVPELQYLVGWAD
ncbi:hypothetical protein CcrColossus_gp066 [Caulobacter phage CcrColossus]|uniref:Uncharacterized protein n=1 Tax=Caulobacter phage CcrColossus TaxID=1211640 RepID=K4JS64_9CAUD|nr:hypothetical protein CcrColossus_gp066 [Caulobacter phage CcrColossus]AFU87936.1 hypothetical protein CcrColossus_gp066 [Caulobacter phage CcrColossus]